VLPTKATIIQSGDEPPLWLTNFIDIYQNLSVDNVAALKLVYHPDIVFQDPLHLISGFDDFADYFDQLYQNVSACRFVINQVMHQGDSAAVYWTMTYQHKQLNGGKSIDVEGHSFLTGRGDKVICHRDYLDLGQMIYEHVPVFGGVVRWLKKRVKV
jgi:ketosteroid isomerase-like protein